jgi:hypothetical protein
MLLGPKDVGKDKPSKPAVANSNDNHRRLSDF